MSGHILRIGLLTASSAQHHTLNTLVKECGHTTEVSLLLAQLKGRLQANPDSVDTNSADPNNEEYPVDAWVVDAEAVDQDDDDNVDAWLDSFTVPVIYCDEGIPSVELENYRAWARRLKDKLVQLSGTINLQHSADGCAKQVWVLGASTGGPNAVKQFLGELPPKLDVGFVYVQHIDKAFNDTLAHVMSRHTHYPATLIEHGDIIRPNTVAIVSPEYRTHLLPNGTFSVSDEAWPGPYSPSIDSMVADVAHSYSDRGGVIVFTGMGDDGAASCRMMVQKGGKVWAQTPSSCTSESMPESVIETGCVEYKGAPYALAQQLVRERQSARFGSATASGYR